MSRPATTEEITRLLVHPTPDLLEDLLEMATSVEDLAAAIKQLEAADAFDDVQLVSTPEVARLRELIRPTVRDNGMNIVRGRD